MTIINNSGFNTSSSISTQHFTKRAAQPADTQAAASSSRTSTQPDKADPYAALISFINQWKDAQQAIKRTIAATQDIGQSRKAMAAEVVRRLKEQLRIMMSMMAGMDPKAKARLIAQMSRELAAAVREYAAASGGGAQGNVSMTADNAGAQNDNAASSGGEQSTNAGAAAATSETSPGDTPEASAEGAVPAAITTPAASPSETTGSPRKVGELVRGQLAEYSQNSGSPDAKADQEFAMEVRKLAAMLKALAKQSEVRAQKNPEKSTKRETASTNDALKEVESSLASIASANTAVTISISVVAK